MLLLINGVFISFLATILEKARAVLANQSVPIFARVFFGGSMFIFILSLVFSIVAVFTVIISRTEGTMRRQATNVLYFGHIASKRTPGEYVDSFYATNMEDVLRDLTAQNYDLARIAQQKFSRFNQAYFLSIMMFVTWIVMMGILFLFS